jgi:hypothetical protein
MLVSLTDFLFIAAIGISKIFRFALDILSHWGVDDDTSDCDNLFVECANVLDEDDQVVKR